MTSMTGLMKENGGFYGVSSNISFAIPVVA